MSKIAITLGDPCSIGGEITKKALLELDLPPEDIILIGCKSSFGEMPEGVEFIDIEPSGEFETGKPCRCSGEVAFNSIIAAIKLAKAGKVAAIVTSPISKYAINLAGHDFEGHTEIFDEYLSEAKNAQMLFVTGDLRVLLLTRHMPLSKVPEALTKTFIEKEIRKLNDFLKSLNIKSPKIALCGLNPHAGERGLLGDEEQKEFVPAVQSLFLDGIEIEGPFAADTLFAKAANAYRSGKKQPYDCYVACYHDQGLCAVKSIDIDKTVNVTLGLDVLRTSPAHGTAFDIAGHGVASAESMKQAIIFAYENAQTYGKN